MAGLFESALSGERPASSGPALFDRMLRIAIGLALLYLAYTGGFDGLYLLAALSGAVALFSAVYDRCPIWNALAPRVKALLWPEKKA
jgi:thioredoxin 1